MATKKQKHAAALARREAFLAEERELGKQALEAARREREERNLAAWKKGHEKHFKFVDECPHCASIKKQQAEKARLKAIEKVALSATKNKDTKVLDTPVDGVLPQPMVMMLNFESAHPTQGMESPQPTPIPELQFSNRDALRGAFSRKARA